MKKGGATSFESADLARSYIKEVACGFTDPTLTLEFLNALDIATASLVYCLIEEERRVCLSVRDRFASYGEFQLAAQKLRTIIRREVQKKH